MKDQLQMLQAWVLQQKRDVDLLNAKFDAAENALHHLWVKDWREHDSSREWDLRTELLNLCN